MSIGVRVNHIMQLLTNVFLEQSCTSFLTTLHFTRSWLQGGLFWLGSAFKWLVGAEMALIFLINGAEQSRVALYKKGSSHRDGFAVFAWNTCHTFNLGTGLVHLTSRVRLTHKWDEFWNMHLLMTKYDHPGMTQCSWQDIEIQLLT